MEELTKRTKPLSRRLFAAGKEIETIARLSRDALNDTNEENAFRGAFRTLEKYYTKFENLVDEIHDLYDEYEPLEAEPRPKFPDSYHEKILKAVKKFYAECNTNFETINARSIRSTTSQNITISETKTSDHLPKISLPKFDGELTKWPKFRDTFMSIVHNDNNIALIRKYHHLLSSLIGPALAVVKHIPLEEAKYQAAWKAITDVYDNKRMLASAYLNHLINFKPIYSKQTAESLKSFLSEIAENVAAFKSLNIENATDFILFHLAMRCLDQKTREDFELVQDANLDFPGFDDLHTFIRNRCKALELANTNNIHLNSSSASSSKSASQPRDNTKVKALVSNERSDSAFEFSKGGRERPSIPYTAKCGVCQNSHNLRHCDKFLAASVNERHRLLKSWKGCKNCLSEFHSTSKCNSKWNCRICKRRHNSLLHFENTTNVNIDSKSLEQLIPAHESANNPSTKTPTNALNTYTRDQDKILLGTALIEILDSRSNFQTIRAVIDSGSQHSFITSRCLYKLGLKSRRFPKTISGIGQTIFDGARGQTSCLIRPRYQATPTLSTDAIVVPNITSFLPTAPIDPQIRSVLLKYELADPNFWEPSGIQFLLGADLFAHILTGSPLTISDELPKLVPSIFGHLVMGKLSQQSAQNTVSLFSEIADHDDINKLLSRFWETEEVNVSIPPSEEDIKCEEHFRRTHYRLPSGRYVVRLPFRDENSPLGDSSTVALRRFHNLEAKLNRDSELKTQYHDFMSEYLSLGHMSLTSNPSQFIIPHHGITKVDRNKVKLRVVFDGSLKVKGGSLNDALLVGPKLQKDIKDILLNFRTHGIVFVADIVKMYRQIIVDTEDRAYQHIYFRFNQSEPIQKFALNTLTYGLTSSPFLALRVINQLLIAEGSNFPQASEVLSRDIYIDDLATGASNVPDALELQRQVIAILKRGGFELSKWASNSPELLKSVATDDSACASNQPFSITSDNDRSLKILGIKWDPVSDSFSYDISPPSVQFTKRSMLSNVAKIYDPLGFISPFTFSMKAIIQELWKVKLDWDDGVPNHIAHEWKLLLEQLHLLSNIKIDRYVGCSEPYQYHLVGFCDASNRGYCAVVYLRTLSATGIRIHFLIAKTKLAPVKQISIPRLELCGALLLARLVDSLSDFVKILPESRLENIFFTDSSIVLSWLNTPTYKLKTFVGNRITEIQTLTKVACWRHVISEDNAGDCGSRGLTPQELLNHNVWWKGPTWLSSSVDQWPDSFFTSLEDLPEIKLSVLSLLERSDVSLFIRWMSRVSSYLKLLRYVAWIKRLIHNRKNAQNKITGQLTSKEIDEALLICVKHVQNHYFFNGSSTTAAMQPFIKLNPFIDDRGILRVGGRLEHSNLSYSHKHPILLPTDAHLTKIMVDHFHRLYLHPGPTLLQALIQCRFWVPSLRRVVRQRSFLCVRCYKFRAKPHIPKMGDLPSYRLQGGRAFMYVGVDFAGPFALKESLRRKAAIGKVYLCIFVCMSTKAVHLEAVTNMTTEAFLACLSRFTSRRGVPVEMFSDCGANFIGAARVLGDFAKWFRDQDTQDSVIRHAAGNGFKWHFNPPHAPHFGGLWEAGVRSVKGHLVRVAGNIPLTYEEFAILLAKVEALLNSRPLCPLSNDPTENNYLSPGHFLIGAPLLALPEASFRNCSENRLTRWQLLSKINEEIWLRWKQEYLSTLQKRTKWTANSKNLQTGGLVLLKKSDTPPLEWPLAQVSDTHPGLDGNVRVVTIRTPTAEYRRPVSDLIPLFPLQTDPYELSS